MTFGAYLLPSGRREGQKELQRYVRHEYRDDNSCWFGAENGHGPCVRLPGEAARRTMPQPEPVRAASVPCDAGTGCPVLNAISKGGAIAAKPARGETSGRQ